MNKIAILKLLSKKITELPIVSKTTNRINVSLKFEMLAVMEFYSITNISNLNAGSLLELKIKKAELFLGSAKITTMSNIRLAKQ